AKSKRARRLMLYMVIGVVLVFGVGAFIVWNVLINTEDNRYADAKRLYEEERFGPAAKAFRKLSERFPGSSRADQHRLFTLLCELRGGDREEIGVTLQNMNDFLTECMESETGKAMLQERKRDLGQTLVKQVEEYFEEQQGQPIEPSLEETL